VNPLPQPCLPRTQRCAGTHSHSNPVRPERGGCFRGLNEAVGLLSCSPPFSFPPPSSPTHDCLSHTPQQRHATMPQAPTRRALHMHTALCLALPAPTFLSPPLPASLPIPGLPPPHPMPDRSKLSTLSHPLKPSSPLPSSNTKPNKQAETEYAFLLV